MAPLPLLKLGLLAVRQVMKPITARVTQEAKQRPVFRRFIIVPIAQVYHRMETNFKMLLLGFGKPVHVEPLSEQMAIDLGSSILSEGLIFTAAAGLMVFEYNRGAIAAAAKENRLQDRLATLEARLQDVSFQMERQKAVIRELEHAYAWRTSPLSSLRRILPGGSRSRDEDDDNDGEPSQSPSELADAVDQKKAAAATADSPTQPAHEPLQRSVSEPAHASAWQRIVNTASEALGIDSFSTDHDIDVDDEID